MSGVGDAGALHALVRMRLASGVEPDAYETHLRPEAAVAEAWQPAGDCDYELWLACRSIADLDTVVNGLRAAGGVTSTILVFDRVPLEA